MKKFFIPLFILVTIFTPVFFVKAADTYTLLAPIGKLTTAPENIGEYLNTIFIIIISLCAALAVIMIIIGGIQYMGDESVFGKTEAKSKIIRSILGLLIALGSWAILNTINPDLIGGNIHIDQVSASIDPEPETEPWTGTANITGKTALCTDGYSNVATFGSPSTINVCNSVALNLTKMIVAAHESPQSLVISGSGSRSYDQQQKLRKDHGCSDPNTPSNSCTPPTARPGHSKHESGKAVDFKCNGGQIKGSPCFTWLKNNAKNYGFYNLSSEPWHWSDDGH